MSSRRIAVIGSGVAGLTAGYVLARTDDVTLFEAGDRLGGHAHTHLLPLADGRELPVDTGFIVHNERTYPLLTKLFTEIGVTTTESEMSMSVRCAGCGLQYAGQRGPRGLAAGVRHGRGRYIRMLGEVLRFHRSARGLLDESGYNEARPLIRHSASSWPPGVIRATSSRISRCRSSRRCGRARRGPR